MFNTKKFGGYLSCLRKSADMTQSELAEKLNLTRQAISNYERGDSFPDVSILVLIADIFCISLDDLINSGEPTRGEAIILSRVAIGDNIITDQSFSDIAGIAPLLKPSVLDKLSEGLSKQGIDISNIISLAEYLSNDSVIKLLENATFDTLNTELLEKLLPFFDEVSKRAIFQKILDGEIDWHMISVLVPYAEYITPEIEAAVLEGALPQNVLDILNNYYESKNGYK